MQLITVNTVFLGKGMVVRNAVTGMLEVSSVMSPLQAVHIFRGVYDIKRANPAYQQTPAEWEEMVKNHPQDEYPSKTTVSRAQSPRLVQLDRAVLSGVNSFSMTDGLALMKSTLNHLGVTQ